MCMKHKTNLENGLKYANKQINMILNKFLKYLINSSNTQYHYTVNVI